MTKAKLQTLMKSQWVEALYPFFQTESFKKLSNKLAEDRKTTITYPAKENTFRVFNELDIDEIKVVWYGQDCYHGCYYDNRPQAIGRAFALDVTGEMNIQPSLRNILKEMESDIGSTIGFDYSMNHLVEQGVFLLNTSLTVTKGQPNSHSFYWKEFTKLVCETLNKKDNLVHLMMGKDAQSLKKYFTNPTHKFVETAHPSPLATGFKGSKPFSLVNKLLKYDINWLDSPSNLSATNTYFIPQEEIEIIPPKDEKEE